VARCVGFTMTTVAFLTAWIEAWARSSWCARSRAALSCGSPSDSFASCFTSALDIRRRAVCARRTRSRSTKAAARITRATSRASPRASTPDAARSTRGSPRPLARSGRWSRRELRATTITTPAVIRPRASDARRWAEKRLPRPFSGDSLARSGRIFFSENTPPACTPAVTIASTAHAATRGSESRRTAGPSSSASAESTSPVDRRASTMDVDDVSTRSWATAGASATPRSSTAADVSVELTATSPSSAALCNRRGVGSSVLSLIFPWPMG
jgi:hypothetical protein